MTPTLIGRIQTRIFAVFAIGLPWMLILGPFLPGTGDASLGGVYASMFVVLMLVGVLGGGWELIYHGLQQYRWEKDWPTMFGLFTGVSEGIVLYPFARAVASALDVLQPGVAPFVWHFGTTWVLIWIVLNGPMRVLSLRWRFYGGRLV